MSKPLDAVLDNAEEGTGIICALNRESVQIIFFALSLTENKRVWLEDYYDIITDDELDQIRDMREIAEREIITLFDYEALMEYPEQVTLWHDSAPIYAGSGLSQYQASNLEYGTVSFQNPAAGLDTFGWYVLLDAGDYKFSTLGIKSNNYGIVTWAIDGDTILTQDLYSSINVFNFRQSVDVTIAAKGRYFLSGNIGGKNASSAGYYAGYTKYGFAKTP